MDVKAFEQDVRAHLGQARDALGRIEMHVRETQQEDPHLMAASRFLARFCMHAREYVTGSTLNRPLPHKFADEVIVLVAGLRPLEAALAALDVGPRASDLEALAHRAHSLPARIR